MASEENVVPEPWWMGIKEVKKRCPGHSNKQVREAFDQSFRDVERAVSYLNSLNQKAEDSPSTCTSTPTAYEEKQEESFPWLRQLPRLPRPGSTLSKAYDNRGFDLRKVLGAIQDGVAAHLVRDYLAYYQEHDREQLEDAINQNVEQLPAIFYVAEANNPELIRYWIKYGGDPNATYGKQEFPLMAYVILRGHKLCTKATEMLRTLLVFGASPDVIPSAFYHPYNKDLPKSGPARADLQETPDFNQRWWKSSIWPWLTSSLSLTQRYLLYRAYKNKPASGRQRALVHRKNSEGILGMHLLLIGQEMGITLLKRTILAHLALPSKKPMVILFAGPSGHGKTELAHKFKELLSLQFYATDSTQFTRQDELLGGSPTYKNSEMGSDLNNFLASQSGNRSIVFMDEFEKTSTEVRDALLVRFDQGKYVDRRNLTKVDCSQTIWILATNQFDDTIHEFCETNKQALLDGDLTLQRSLTKQLTTRLRRECMAHLGAPTTGRLTEIIPFLTFSPDEQAVVAHKYYMELEEEVFPPIKLTETKKDDILVGNVRLNMKSDTIVCSKIANESYLPQLGARSIKSGFDRLIKYPMVEQYQEDGHGYAEDQEKTYFTIGVDAEKEVEVWLTPKTSEE